MEGTLFIVGGGLIQSADEVFAELIRRAGGANGRFAFIVSASGMDMIVELKTKQEDILTQKILAVPGVENATLMTHDGEVTY